MKIKQLLKSPSLCITITIIIFISLAALFSKPSAPADQTLTRRPFISRITAVPKRPPLLPPPWVHRTGIVDDFGAMAMDFLVGDSDPDLVREWAKLGEPRRTGIGGFTATAREERFGDCNESLRDFVPCLDNVGGSGDRRFERNCPLEGKGLDCLVKPPRGYRKPLPWPQSRDKVWLSNLPDELQIEDKGGSNLTSADGDMFIFPGVEAQSIHEADHYINQISKMVSEIEFGKRTRVVLDIGCGMASFGAFLSQHNVTTLSIAAKDVHENPVQFALERGVPAMIAVFATHRLLYPSQGFDLIHCSRCRINWTRDDGVLLLEASRILRAGGYFVWSAHPSDKHENNLEEYWKEIKDLAFRMCWKLVKEEEEIVIWQKPFNNSCYFNPGNRMRPPICDDDDPDNVWYVGLKACISLLPNTGYGFNVTSWPERLHRQPDRLQSIKLDAEVSRKDLFIAESNYWNEIIDGYVRYYHWKELKFRNVMDMRAGFGGFAAAMLDFQIDCWVMNVVPVGGFNTLPVIYDRGLLGVVHDWCEPFDTYPRTYDLLHAAGLFSTEKERCNISTIMLEMDRILRPSGHVYIRDIVSIMGEINETAAAMGWVTALHDTAEGPHANWKVLVCEKHSP